MCPSEIFDRIIFHLSVNCPVLSCGQRTTSFGEADVKLLQLFFAEHSWSQVVLPHPCCAQGGTSHWQGRSLDISQDVEGDQCCGCFLSPAIPHVNVLANLFK